MFMLSGEKVGFLMDRILMRIAFDESMIGHVKLEYLISMMECIG